MLVTTEYMAETASAMIEAGYKCELESIDRLRDGHLIYEGRRWTLRRDGVVLELEALRYPGGNEVFYLKIVQYHGISASSFPLDSWKLRPERVEFKYYTHPETGIGLAFDLSL
ncbi:MAG: hypothetical protein K0V04_42810 [Deltaproteobacteria bacterium]|nr:hypothetical protein [Deltaproteobacteria bacterium]